MTDRARAFLRFRRDTVLRVRLLHITSPPSDCGIDHLGPDAFGWLDRLTSPGRRWQASSSRSRTL
jgi:hypothetical protein